MKNNLVIFFLIVSQFTFGQYGVLDTSFNGTGHNQTSFTSINSYADHIVFQPNGKTLFAGSAEFSNPNITYAAFVRANEDGTYDDTFGTNGVKLIRVKNATQTRIRSITKVNEDNYYLLTTGGPGYSLTKLNSDCIIDTNYGTNGTIDLAYGNFMFTPYTILVAIDGSFTVLGSARETTTSPGGMVVGKYHADGTVDTTYGTNGFIFLTLNDMPYAVTGRVYQLDSGKFLVVGNYGYTDPNNSSLRYRNAFLKRYNADGTIDVSYGINGTVLNSEISTSLNTKVDGDGNVILWANPQTLLSNTDSDTAPSSLRIIQFDSAGNFINQPNIHLSPNLLLTKIRSVIEQNDGKMLIAGNYFPNINLDRDNFICRYMPDGTLDSTFGIEGIFTASFSGYEYLDKIALAPDQKLVFSGSLLSGNNYEFSMGRLTTGITLGNISFSQVETVVAYPNPVQSTASLQYVLEQAENLTIALYDLTGKLVKEFVRNSPRTQGEHTEILQMEGYDKGNYIIKLTNDSNYNYATKIILK